MSLSIFSVPSGVWLRRIVYCSFLSLSACFPIQAQIATAGIDGTVRDNTDAVIPGASIELPNQDTNVLQSTVTNDTGSYALLRIPPGHCTLTASKPGFETVKQENITLVVGQETAFDSLQTLSADLGITLSSRTLSDLPLNGRNFTAMLDQTPEVSTDGK